MNQIMGERNKGATKKKGGRLNLRQYYTHRVALQERKRTKHQRCTKNTWPRSARGDEESFGLIKKPLKSQTCILLIEGGPREKKRKRKEECENKSGTIRGLTCGRGNKKREVEETHNEERGNTSARKIDELGGGGLEQLEPPKLHKGGRPGGEQTGRRR